MESKKIGQTAAIIGGLILATVMAFVIQTNSTGGIAGLSKLFTFIGLVIGLVSPRAGIFFLAGQAMYSDELKRIAAYYGTFSTQTVQEVLIGPLLTLCAINVSFIVGVIRKKYEIDRLGLLLYLIIPIIGAGLLLGSRATGLGLTLKLYNTATICLYITLIPVCYGLFSNLDEWVSFISLQVLLAVPAAAWGIWQYYNGFNAMEWAYGLSGLSPTHTGQMLLGPKPRIFGLFGSASAYGSVHIYGAFAIWRACHVNKKRILYLCSGVIFLAAAVYSEQRSLLLYPFIFLLLSYLFRRFITTAAVYSTIFVGYIAGALSASYFLTEGLENINKMIAVDTPWGQNVLTVNTFAERLYGWERLTKPETWSLLGNKNAIEASYDLNAGINHDIINKILIGYGAVGLLCAVTFVAVLFYLLHRFIFQTTDLKTRNCGAFIMACTVPIIIMSFIAGDNFSTTPTNMQIWSVFSGVFIIKKLTKKKLLFNNAQSLSLKKKLNATSGLPELS